MRARVGIEIVFALIDSNQQGLYIGLMANQALAIFYLNDFDRFVKKVLKIKYYERYQDDFLLFHEYKEYLRFCFEEIKKEKLKLNNKSSIYKNTDNFMFLGRNIKDEYIRFRNIKKHTKIFKLFLFSNCFKLFLGVGKSSGILFSFFSILNL